MYLAGQYHWVAALSQPRHRRISSWVTGWISVGGQTVLTTSAAFAAGLQCQALITLNHPSFKPKPWQGVLFFWLVVTYSAVVNIWLIKLMPGHNLAAGKLAWDHACLYQTTNTYQALSILSLLLQLSSSFWLWLRRMTRRMYSQISPIAVVGMTESLGSLVCKAPYIPCLGE